MGYAGTSSLATTPARSFLTCCATTGKKTRLRNKNGELDPSAARIHDRTMKWRKQLRSPLAANEVVDMLSSKEDEEEFENDSSEEEESMLRGHLEQERDPEAVSASQGNSVVIHEDFDAYLGKARIHFCWHWQSPTRRPCLDQRAAV